LYEEKLVIQPAQPISWGRRLKVHHLEILLVLAGSATLTGAAQRMHMTQSAMSHWLKDLEDLIGAPLFIRGRKLALTPAGEVLHRHALRILGDVRRTQADLASVVAGAVGHLRVGTVHSGQASLLPGAIAAFQRQADGVSIRTAEGTLRDLFEGLERRDLDLVIVPIDNRLYRPDLRHEVLLEDTMEVVVGPAHPLADRSDVGWEALQAYPWIVPPVGTLMHHRLGSALVGAGVSILPRVESGSIVTVQALLRSTDCVSVLAGLMARHLQALGLLRVVAMREPHAFGTIGVVWEAAGASALVEQFIDVLRVQARELSAPKA
jgi:DNA-binding transcriptional LysR family regulator